MNNTKRFLISRYSFLALFILFGLSLSPIKGAQALGQESQTPQPGKGQVEFDQAFFDFGNVIEGEIVKHTFKFKNVGDLNVKLVKTETSCGCTTAKGVFKSYAPGEQGEMEIVVDTKGKKGIIVKTVTVTMENNQVPTVELSLTMKLEPPPHPKIDNVHNINTEANCKSCHLESGVGQMGIFLYHRVCSQCHGKKGVGGMARALNDEKWQQAINDDYISQKIRLGQAELGMPSYVDGVTPPLTEPQVDSLIQYIRSLVQPLKPE